MPANLPPSPRLPVSGSSANGLGLIDRLKNKVIIMLLTRAQSMASKLVVRYASVATVFLIGLVEHLGLADAVPDSAKITTALAVIFGFIVDVSLSYVTHKFGIAPKAIPVADGEQ